MLADLQKAAQKRGLILHPDKTNILTNATKGTGRPRTSHVQVGDMNIKIAPYGEKTKYLGRQLCFDRPHDVEVDHRISMAWKSFMAQRAELVNNTYSLNVRLKLFDATVSNVLLCGSATWVLTQELTDKLRRVQRKMLRMIYGSRRRPVAGCDPPTSTSSSVSSYDSAHDRAPVLEPWAEWCQRATHEVEERCSRLRVRDWIESHKSAATQWYRKMQEAADSWAHRAFRWEPLGLTRRSHRPRKRWIDAVLTYI